MSLKFGEIKQQIYLNQVGIDKMVIADTFKLLDGVISFIEYKNDDIVTPSCIILPQMSGFIKYFENNKKDILFLADDDVILKYKKTKILVSVKFDS